MIKRKNKKGSLKRKHPRQSRGGHILILEISTQSLSQILTK